jgi:hypothetical protein
MMLAPPGTSEAVTASWRALPVADTELRGAIGSLARGTGPNPRWSPAQFVEPRG